MPTFSPTTLHPGGTWVARLGLWLMPWAAAIWFDQPWAIETSRGSTLRARTPTEERTWLSNARNCVTSAWLSALATLGVANPMNPQIMMTAAPTAANKRFPISHLHA